MCLLFSVILFIERECSAENLAAQAFMGFIFQLVLRADRKHVNNRTARKSNECGGGYTCKRKRNTKRLISALNNSIIYDCSFSVSSCQNGVKRQIKTL